MLLAILAAVIVAALVLARIAFNTAGWIMKEFEEWRG